jgi:hypothetical protein
MGYDARVVLVSGVAIPREELENIAKLLFDRLDFNNPDQADRFYEQLSDGDGVPIPTGYMGSPYRFIHYDNGGFDVMTFIQLDSSRISVVREADPPKEVHLPDENEIAIFMNFVESKGISYPFGTWLVISGG